MPRVTNVTLDLSGIFCNMTQDTVIATINTRLTAAMAVSNINATAIPIAFGKRDVKNRHVLSDSSFDFDKALLYHSPVAF